MNPLAVYLLGLLAMVLGAYLTFRIRLRPNPIDAAA